MEPNNFFSKKNGWPVTLEALSLILYATMKRVLKPFSVNVRGRAFSMYLPDFDRKLRNGVPNYTLPTLLFNARVARSTLS